MNTQTLILTVLIIWLIMGLAFLSSMSEVKRTGGDFYDALKTNEAFFFVISLVCGIAVILVKIAN